MLKLKITDAEVRAEQKPSTIPEFDNWLIIANILVAAGFNMNKPIQRSYDKENQSNVFEQSTR